MDTDDGSGELAAAAAAALASQEERAAAEAAAAAARQARREKRRAEKEARRQKLLQVRPGGTGCEAGMVLQRRGAGKSWATAAARSGLCLRPPAHCAAPMEVQEKKDAKARARAEAQRRYEDQLQRWEAAVADKRQQVAELQQQVRCGGASEGQVCTTHRHAALLCWSL